MSLVFHYRNLRSQLAFWFLGVTTLSLVSAVTILYYQRSAVIRGREFEKLQVIRDLKVRELTAWLEERSGDMRVAASDLEIRALEDHLRATGEPTALTRQKLDIAKSLLHRYVDHYDAYRELFVVDASSRKVVISTEPTHIGDDWSADGAVTEPLRTRKAHIEDVYFSRRDRQPAMSISAPIFCTSHEGRHLIGILVASLDLEHVLYPLLQHLTGEGKTGETLIVNRNATAINELRWYRDAPLKLQISAEPAVRAARGETGVVETNDYRDEPVLAAYTHIPSMHWGFVAKRDLTEVDAPIRAMLREMGFIVAGALFIVLALSIVLAGTISRPILAISRAVRRFADGDFSVRCVPTGADEVVDLGEMFNRLATTLDAQHQIQRGGAQIAETMVAAGDIERLALGLLTDLLELTASHLGAFYLRSRDDRQFEAIASIGLDAGSTPSFSADDHEGEMGMALATGKMCSIRDIPEDTIFALKTTAGVATAREIITVPLAVEGRIMAVISLATLGSYGESERQILTRAKPGMCTALANHLANGKTEHMARALRINNEELAALNKTLRDQATELEIQRMQVDSANRLKSQFLSNMSHELRTPLNSVMALSQLMLARGVGKNIETDTEHLHAIERNGQRLLRLIDDILDLSKIEAGRMDIVITDFDARDLVERAVGTVRPIAQSKALDLNVVCAEPLRIRSDEHRIGDILLNFLSNAIKFTERGRIAVDVTSTGESVSFAVSDTGVGIRARDHLRIFDAFRQLDGSVTRRYEGTGLGLSISRKLARLLGGEVTVESTVGKGSTFTLIVPRQCSEFLADASDPPERGSEILRSHALSAPPSSNGQVRADKAHILVTEDNDVAALQVQTALEEAGYAPTVVTSGVAALESVRLRVPDAIVLDLMMPDVDGFEVIESLRSDHETADIPVLVLTAKELTRADLSRLARNHIRQLIQKGNVNRDELVARVTAMLDESLPADATATPPQITPDIAPTTARDSLVLVVEDNPDNLLALTAIIDSIGCRYVTAADGERAVKMARECKPALILMDIQLPIMSGLDATRQIKSDPSIAEIPIVALTARAMKGDREEILAAGCADYVAKPLNPAEVIRVVHNYLGIDGGES